MIGTAAKRLVGRSLFHIFEMLHRRPARAERGSVVIVRADGIGDLVFSLPVLESIRRTYAPMRCVLVCNSAAASFINELGVVDEVLPYDTFRYRWNPIYRLSVWSKLRNVAPSVAISLGFHRSPTSEELTLATGAETTMCMSGNDEMIPDSDRRRFDKRYSLVVEVPDHVSERERYEVLAKSQGWPSIEWSREYSVRSIRPKTRPVIAFCPGGSAEIRRWPLDRWVDLVQRFAQNHNVECRLIGGTPDRRLLESISSRLGDTVAMQIAVDVLSLAKHLGDADVVVGLDAGASHVATRAGIPTVVILGGGHFSRYFPYGKASVCNAVQECYECNWRCTRDKNYCLTEISPEQVRAEVERRLGEKS